MTDAAVRAGPELHANGHAALGSTERSVPGARPAAGPGSDAVGDRHRGLRGAVAAVATRPGLGTRQPADPRAGGRRSGLRRAEPRRPPHPGRPADRGRARRARTCWIDAATTSPLRSCEPLDQAQRDQMVDAMRTVQRLMTRSLVEIVVADPAGRDANRCIRAYFAELDRRSESKFDPSAGISAEPHELVAPAGAFLIAYIYGEPVGCGAVKHHPGAPSHIKRMWVAESARGLGIGRRLLAELERHVARFRRHGRPTRDPANAHRGIRHVPLGRLSRGAGVQRRAVRASLVREARRLTPVAARRDGLRRAPA